MAVLPPVTIQQHYSAIFASLAYYLNFFVFFFKLGNYEIA
jgi:hypothetical protein